MPSEIQMWSMQRSIRGQEGCETSPSRPASGVKAVGAVWVGRKRFAMSPADASAGRLGAIRTHRGGGRPSREPSFAEINPTLDGACANP